MVKKTIMVLAVCLFIVSPLLAQDAFHGIWSSTFTSKLKISTLLSDSDTTYGTLTLNGDGTFILYENNNGRDRNYTGTYTRIEKKSKDLIYFTLDANGLQTLNTMLMNWVEDYAAGEGASVSDIHFQFSPPQNLKITIPKKTNMPKKLTVKVKGTVSAVLDGTFMSKKFSYSCKIIFASSSIQPPVLLVPSTTTGHLPGSLSYTWPSPCSSSDRYEIEESTTSESSGFTNINTFHGCGSTQDFDVDRDSGVYYYRARVFVGSGQFPGYSPYSSAEEVTVTVTLEPYILEVSKQGSGTGMVTGTGINCGSDCSESYTSGTQVTLTASPASGSTFTSWSGCDSPSGTSCTVTMNVAKTVTVTFTGSTPTTYTLIVEKSGTGSGTVTGTGINCGKDCSGSYTSGTQVTLTASPTSGSTFTGWSGGGCSGTGTCTVTMDAAKTVTATFWSLTLAPDLQAKETSTGSFVVKVSYDWPEPCSMQKTGYELEESSRALDGIVWSQYKKVETSHGCVSPHSFSLQREHGFYRYQARVYVEDSLNNRYYSDYSVTAEVEVSFKYSYTLTISKPGTGSGTVTGIGISCGHDCSGNYTPDTQITLTASPASRSSFTSWANCDSPNGTSCTVTMNRNKTVAANFTSCCDGQVTDLDIISAALVRFSCQKPNGRVDLCDDSNSCNNWVGTWFQHNEPKDNYCGPTAGMNLLHWYTGLVPKDTYDQLGSEMHTNNWMSWSEAISKCYCFCSLLPRCLLPDPLCVAACPIVANLAFDVGTHPDDMESGLRKHSLFGASEGYFPVRYLLFRHKGNPGLEALEYRLAQGNPIVVLIWTGDTLHWTTVVGTYDKDGTTMVRFANHGNQTWDWFVHQWSFEGLNWPVPGLLSDFGIKSYVWMHYEKTTLLTAGQRIFRGQNMTSEDGRFNLTIDDAGHLVLFPLPFEPENYLWTNNVSDDGWVLGMQDDGNLVLWNSANAVVWQSHTDGNQGAYLALQNDGNLVIYDANNFPIWETGTGGH